MDDEAVGCLGMFLIGVLALGFLLYMIELYWVYMLGAAGLFVFGRYIALPWLWLQYTRHRVAEKVWRAKLEALDFHHEGTRQMRDVAPEQGELP